MKRSTLTLALALAVAQPVAAMMIEMPLEEVIRASDVVVQGRVIAMNSRFLDQPRIIVTDVTVLADDAWSGTLPPDRQLTFTVHGGVVGELRMWQEHQPVFSLGERALLFLKSRPDGSLGVSFDEQGKYRIAADQAVSYRGTRLLMPALRTIVARLKPATGR